MVNFTHTGYHKSPGAAALAAAPVVAVYLDPAPSIVNACYLFYSYISADVHCSVFYKFM